MGGSKDGAATMWEGSRDGAVTIWEEQGWCSDDVGGEQGWCSVDMGEGRAAHFFFLQSESKTQRKVTVY